MIMFVAYTPESYLTGPRTARDVFQLYVPGGGQTALSWQHQHEYDEVKLSRLGATAAAGMMGASIGVGGAGSSLIGGAFRTIINPAVEVLYRGTTLRNFIFSFMFAPERREDSVQLYGAQTGTGILNRFRYHAAPEVAGDYREFFKSPSEWEIAFYYKAADGRWRENQKIPKIAKSVLTRVDVDYGPDSEFSTFEGGEATSSRLTMDFREMEIIDKKRIETDGL